MGTTVFEHMSGLARELGAINLGQGYPDGPEPPELIEAAARALREKSNQYPPSGGVPELRAAIADFYRRTQGLELQAHQVVVTSGATEALAAAIFALVKPGDEVILFEPTYDAYAPLIRRAGATPVFVPLVPPSWSYERRRIEAAVTPRTRAIVLNDPLNPTGTVASVGELEMLAGLCCEHDLIAICDEVWEDVRFDGSRQRSLLGCPGMAERAVKIGSAGKIFGLTGWKIGWACAGPDLARLLGRAHQFLTFTSAPALQWAVAQGLALPEQWFAERTERWAASRARLSAGLVEAGYPVLPNSTSWFLCLDLAEAGIALDDRTFTERAVREAAVAAIPVSALCESGGAPSSIVRLCFTKPDDQLDRAAQRLGDLRQTVL
jgi:aspartate/methionine/tyrosine aminotransferase